MTRAHWWLVATLATIVGCGDGNTPAPPPPPADAADTDGGPDAAPPDSPKAPDVQSGPDVASPDVKVGPDAEPPDAAVGCMNAGEVRCGELCVNTQSNNANCGACSRACSGAQSCRSGMCVEEVPCPDGQQRCGVNCTNATRDPANCGACGNVCPAGQACSGGSCVEEMPCATGQTRCAGACTDTAADANNCGICGNACTMGQSCAASVCRVSVMCTSGQTACGGSCTNTMSDLANCGSCGNACPSGQVCAAGSCSAMECPAEQTRCGSACANLMTDRINCGSCGRSCATGQTCAGGMCAGMMMCPAGQVLCGTGSSASCSNTTGDPANCGRCGNLCALGQTCSAGVCLTPRMCPTGQTDCTPMGAAMTCLDLQTSAMNCGSCARACPMSETCIGGTCACPSGTNRCGRSCVNFMLDNANCGACGSACPRGLSCMGGACRCPTGQSLCGGACVNPMTDTNNCGMCGRACPMGQVCASGACACPSGQTACGTPSTCVNSMTDRANCGRCDNACASGQTCAGGACACPSGQIPCGTPASCVNAMNNAANCGRCGNACARGTSCVGGVCRGTPPANDTRAGATPISLTTPALTLSADTSAATNNTSGSCGCTSGNDVFFSFTLSQPELIYADTLGATWDTSLFIQSAPTGANVTAAAPFVSCNDDLAAAGLCALTGLQTQIAVRLAPGAYYLVLSGCGAGAAMIHFQHLPAGNGASARVTPNATVQTVTGTTSGTGTVGSTCCSGGADNSYWWLTCPDTAATSFHATSCSALGANTATYDNEIAQYSALRPASGGSVCNDDIGGTCGFGASVTSTVPATVADQVGLNTFVADSCSGAGAYTLSYVLANCASGARCGAGCIDTNSDVNHCGGCSRRCAAGNVCAAGACVPPPPNDTPAGATVINMGVPQSTFTVNTLAAANHTLGSCGCTSGRDVFYSFTIAGTVPEMIYADTIGSTFDTSLFVQTSGGINVTASGLPSSGVTCNDDLGLTGCSTGLQSQILLQLNPGTYRLVLSGCGNGAASLRFQHAPVGNGAIALLAAGSSTPGGTTTGAGRVNLGCSAGGPENTYYWYRCPSATTADTFTASTCGRASWDTSLSQYSPGRTATSANACADDTCGLQSSITSTIPAGPGLHLLYVDGFGGSSGPYTISVARP